jgi:sugar phosphate permease
MKNKYLDLLERTAWTAVQSFFGVMAGIAIVEGGVDWKATFYSAGIAALIAVAKCIIAFQVGNPASAAMPETEPPK